MAKSKSSQRWLKEHRDDQYVRQANKEGLRSRAAYKLDELDVAAKLIKPGMTVVDLGAAPGGFSQMAARKVAPSGRVIACDILPMATIPGVEFILVDLRRDESIERLGQMLGDSRADLVISDMAPNLSGIASVDQARAFELADMAYKAAQALLRKGGGFLIKLFQGEGFEEYVAHVSTAFGETNIRKPKASRSRSREAYLLARGFKLV